MVAQEAVALLRKEGLQPKFHLLDLGREETMAELAAFMQEHYGGIDILVNNAGIAFKQAATEPFAEQARVTLATNYWANKGCSMRTLLTAWDMTRVLVRAPLLSFLKSLCRI